MTQTKDYVSRIAKSDINRWITSKPEQISVTNAAIFKAKDIGFLDEVVNYLGNYKLNAELDGSVKVNAQKGSPRTYGDIDLVVSGSTDLSSREAVAKLVRVSKGIEKISDWDVYMTAQPEMNECYVGRVIDYRFKIRSKKTNTIIDLNFGRVNVPHFGGTPLTDLPTYGFTVEKRPYKG
jgi:hypothetical protein